VNEIDSRCSEIDRAVISTMTTVVTTVPMYSDELVEDLHKRLWAIDRENKRKKNQQRRDSNPCGQSPNDF
jgi:phage head maturation protease